MSIPRRYGGSPFSIAVIHGGPGAGGEMAPVAQRLCAEGRGILEPLQTAHCLAAQVEELKGTLVEYADLPVTLIGFSWGAWLSFILAARYPAMVKKLVLVGSGPFQEKYVPLITQTRLSRLDNREKNRVRQIFAILDGPNNDDPERDGAFADLGEIFSRTDSLDPMKCHSTELNNAIISCRADIYESVWKEASLMRQTGELLELGKRILCPVVAIHGDWDPHPSKGVSGPLKATLKSFKFILLENCGHKPWTEKRAKDRFYFILEEAIDY